MPVYRLNGVTPVVHPSAYTHPTAVLIGDVIVGPRCYVGPCASLRGDFGRIVLKEGANLQDACVMHGFPGGDTVVERNGHVSHGAVLHGCRIGENTMVGINAVIMDEVVVGKECIVAALSYVRPGFEAPPRSVLAGFPATVKRAFSDDEIAWKSEATARYQGLARRCAHPATASPRELNTILGSSSALSTRERSRLCANRVGTLVSPSRAPPRPRSRPSFPVYREPPLPEWRSGASLARKPPLKRLSLEPLDPRGSTVFKTLRENWPAR